MIRSLNFPILLHDTGSRVCDTKRAVGVGGELDPVGSSTRAEVYSNHWIAEKVTAGRPRQKSSNRGGTQQAQTEAKTAQETRFYQCAAAKREPHRAKPREKRRVRVSVFCRNLDPHPTRVRVAAGVQSWEVPSLQRTFGQVSSILRLP